MSTMRERDWRACFELLQTVLEAGDSVDALARAAVNALPMLVVAEISNLWMCDLRNGQRQSLAMPEAGIGAENRVCFNSYFRTHSLLQFHADPHGPGAYRLSDGLLFSRFCHSELYNGYFRRGGTDYAVSLPVYVDDATLVSFVLNRRDRDFSERERNMLDLVGGPLSRMYRQARALEQLRASLVTLAPDVQGLHARGVTPRETEVLRWLAAGKTDREIAAILGCSYRTVQKHLQRLYIKLGVETRTAAVLRALGG
ncbi:LuxR C-terminal-related transcriptional regulator [Rhodoferax sp.]|uniref:LuxR C-terminal-related transcriptional regulator n=1 Tax=Rhodoferax sp. TaxID=50421 RepID=UPI0025F68002|nr:LuxR C-terminal-related transcriptional regulator [Rhodoferax sp.]